MNWIRPASILLAVGMSWLHAGAEQGSAPPPLLQWFDDQGRPAWAVTHGAPDTAARGLAVPMMAVPWFEDASDLSIEIIGADPLVVADRPGRIILLNFWASWCGPCREELPALQRLQDEERESGLDVVAVNVDEPDRVALAMASDLGLRLPVGRFNERLAGLMDSRKLPSVLLLDGEGRIRKRWSGYRDGLVEVYRREIHTMLAGDPGVFPTMLGAGTFNGDHYEVVWSRDLSRPVGGVGVLVTPDGEPVVAATPGRELVTLRKDGKIVGRLDAPSGMVSLLAVDLNRDGVRDLVGYRRGSRKVATYDYATRTAATWDAPAGLFSLMARQDGDRPVELVAGLLDRTQRFAADGSVLGDPKEDAGAGAWALVTGRSMTGFGAGTSEVVGAAAGRFDGSEPGQVAVATKGGLLMIHEAGTGTLLYEANWAGITALAARDLDRDGTDELIVASGNSVTVLKHKSR